MANWKNVQYKNGQYRTSEGGGGSSTLSGLDDVTISSASNGQVLKYNSTSSKWVNANETATSALSDLTDVDVDTKSDGDVLTYNESTQKWEAAEPLINDVALTDLTDTSVSSPSNGQVLTYDENEDAWINANPTGGASDLDDLGDVTISSATNGQVLKYDSTSSKWINANESGGGASALNDLTDVDTTGVSDNNVLAYSSGQSKWVPASISTGGNVDDVEVNGTSVVDTNKVAKITSYKEVTEAQYEALPSTKLTDGVMYLIKDIPSGAEGYPPLIYSTEEREVGVWTDGKPLYQKNFVISNVAQAPLATPGTLVTLDSTYDIKVLEGYASIGTMLNLPSGNIPYDNGNNEKIEFNIAYNNSNIIRYNLVFTNSSHTGAVNLIIKYTKTTDTPGSGTWGGNGALAYHYSTTEHIIGTWINGEPLYEKVFSFSNISSQSYEDITITNINNLINVNGYSGEGTPIPYNDVGNIAGCVGFYKTSTGVRLTTGASRSLTAGKVIIQYTKTTN